MKGVINRAKYLTDNQRLIALGITIAMNSPGEIYDAVDSGIEAIKYALNTSNSKGISI